MYPVWKKKQLKIKKYELNAYKNCPPRYMVRCEIRKSYRNENGDARAKTVAYIGTIAEEDMDCPLWRKKFWKRVDYMIEKLELSLKEEESLRDKLNKRMPRPQKN